MRLIRDDCLFSLATDFCLEFVDSTISEDLALSLINEVSVSKDDIKANSTIESYVEDLSSEAQGELGKVMKACIENDLDLLFEGKDWRKLIKDKEELVEEKEEKMDEDDEYYNDTEVLEDGQEDPYSEMTELCLRNLSKLLKKLDLEQAVVVHVVA